MIVLAQDFYNKFASAVRANNVMGVRQTIFAEIADLIQNDKPEVIELLTASHIPVSKTPTDTELTNSIAKNGASNKSLQVGLAFLIAKRHGLINTDSNADGQGQPVGNGIIEAVSGGTQTAFTATDAQTTQNDLQVAVLGSVQPAAGVTNKISKKTWYWVIGITAAVVIYYYWNKHQKTKAALGMVVPPAPPAPAPVVAAPVPVPAATGGVAE